MSRQTVGRLLTFVVVFDLVMLATALVPIEWAASLGGGLGHLFLPWFSLAMWIVVPVAAVLSLGVIVWRSRTSAILLLLLYLANKYIVVALAYGLPALEVVSVLLALGYVVGIVATFAYQALPAEDKTPPSRPVEVISLAVAVVLLLTAAWNAWSISQRIAGQRETHAVEFSASSKGPAHVSYSSKSFGAEEADFTGTWSKQITVEGSEDEMTLKVTATDDQGVVHCAITRDGRVLVEQDQQGPGAEAVCHAEVP